MSKHRSHLDSRRPAPAMPGPILGAPKGVNQTGPDFDPIQVIYNENVMPRADGLNISFTTSKGSTPVVSLWNVISGRPEADMVPANLVATQFGILAGIRTDHMFLFDDLPQASFFWFRITAGNDEERIKIGPSAPAEYVDTAGTLQRDLTIYYDRLDIAATGGDGEGDDFTFNCAVYNDTHSDNGLHEESVADFHSESMDSGESIQNPVGGPRTIAKISRRIAVYAMASGSSFGTAYVFVPPKVLPDTPYRWRNDDSASANAWSDIDLPETTGPATLPVPSWAVSSGLFACSFTFSGHAEVTVSDPKGALNQWPREVKTIKLVPPGILPALRGGMPHRIAFGGRRIGLRLDPNGAVFLGLGRIDREDWRELGESNVDLLLAAAAQDGGRGGPIGLTLVARHAAGDLMLGHLANVETGCPDWSPLGLTTAETPQLVQRRCGDIAIFTLDEHGHLQHREIKGGRCGHGWIHHGGPFAGPIAAAEDDDGHLFVAARDANGEVWHRQLGDAHPWHHHTGPIDSLLSMAERKGEAMTLYGLDGKRHVHAHVLGKQGWTDLGTPEEIIAKAQTTLRKDDKPVAA